MEFITTYKSENPKIVSFFDKKLMNSSCDIFWPNSKTCFSNIWSDWSIKKSVWVKCSYICRKIAPFWRGINANVWIGHRGEVNDFCFPPFAFFHQFPTTRNKISKAFRPIRIRLIRAKFFVKVIVKDECYLLSFFYQIIDCSYSANYWDKKMIPFRDCMRKNTIKDW